MADTDAELANRFGNSTRNTGGGGGAASNDVAGNRKLWAIVGATLLIGFIAMITLSVVINNVNKTQAYPNLCTQKDCLWAASELLNNVNHSHNPCENFYGYACGRFKDNYPAETDYTPSTYFNIIRQRNDERVLAILRSPITDGAAFDVSFEAKLKVFYQTCQDEFKITSTGASQFIAAVIQLGGWQALYNGGVGTTAKLNTILQTLHSQYGVDVFFRFLIIPDYGSTTLVTEVKRNILQVYFNDLGMGDESFYIYNSSYYTRAREHYKKYIKTVVQQMQVDSARIIPQPANLADQVVEDVMFVETKLAQVHNDYWSAPDVPENERVKTVGWMSTNMGNMIQWQQLLQAIYKDATIDSNTPVHLHLRDSVAEITKQIGLLTDRQMNNYIMWKFANTYVEQFGWKYLQAKRTFDDSQYTQEKFDSAEDRCLLQLQNSMRNGIDALFLENHYQQHHHKQAQEMYEYVKAAAKARIDRNTWMDAETKAKAKKKFDGMTHLFGYPDWLADRKQVSDYYNTIKFDRNNHFQNVATLKQFDLKKDALALNKPYDPHFWPAGIEQASFGLFTSYNEVYFPAGIMQHPIYDFRVPHFLNYGALGYLIGKTLISAIDERGRQYDEKGAYVESWWTEATKKNFESETNVTGCHERLYDGQKIGPDRELKGWILPSAARISLKTIAGMETALAAYQAFAADKGITEETLPGLEHDTPIQQLYLSFAQMFCYHSNTPETDEYWQFYYGEPMGPIVLDHTIRQIPEFRDAFKCSGQERHQDPKCPGY